MARFIPAKGFEYTVERVAAGVTRGRRTGGRPAAVLASSRPETNLVEIAEEVVLAAQAITAGQPVMPRNKGGLRSARLDSPRLSYDFRRERSGQKRYWRSFSEPSVRVTSSKVIVVVTNVSPAADLVEDGSGPEGSQRFSTSRLFRMPIKQRAYNRMSGNMSLAERRRRGLISGDKKYRAAAARQQRVLKAVDSGKINPRAERGAAGYRPQVEAGGFGSKRALRYRLERRAARQASRSPQAGQMRRQVRGYERDFVEIRGGRIGRSQKFAIKRRRYVAKVGGKHYLFTDRFSRYSGYDIFARALREAAARIL